MKAKVLIRAAKVSEVINLIGWNPEYDVEHLLDFLI
jgi:hypothetical protein